MTEQTIDQVIRKLDRQMDEVLQFLPTLATRDELKPLATQEQLKPLATQEQLKGLATQEQIKGLATQEQIKGLATQEQIKGLATQEQIKALATKDELEALATKDELKALATKEDLKALATKDELKALATKDDLLFLASKEELQATRDTLRQEIRQEGERSRRHMDVVAENLSGRLQLVAEGHTALEIRDRDQHAEIVRRLGAVEVDVAVLKADRASSRPAS